ncbi:chromosome segregation protein SMC [Palleronia sediminis]|uniref:Chromosome partition protein Smc n=1 Tax=Palleronia sediminis TaxID=2547833 RepID=A0A4V3BA38_9RHOB|nr:AAA family ATPase [Palleronia sediminis]TDL81629.1 chromosome segregation protein SMC [Palleronia sediminis]
MQFTRLRLNGFKSFVDPTDLVIQRGLTGVVGPNGCGKSNLLEALRWVMGENRPTAMRGGGMEDVIFAGTARRPARHFAEVSLTVDNADRLAPAGFNDAGVIEIVRRITRDAGSAYKAQGRDVRARDVQMLFADASTGAQSPALVRQGQISELISAKPKARRRILEDAAGIAGLYQRRHEAELKLKSAEANLLRVDDTIEALAAQLGTLARQARQAARYREIGARLREAEGLLLYRRWREADAAREAARAALTDRETEAAAAERQARAAATDRETAEAALPALKEEDGIAAAIVQRLGIEAATLDDEIRRADDLIARLDGRLRQIARDAEREAALGADADGALAALRAEEAELGAADTGHEAALAQAAAAAEDAARHLAEREAALSQRTEDVARLAARHQSAERAVADARADHARASRTVDEAGQAVTQAQAAGQAAGTARAASEARIAEVTTAAAQAEADQAAAEEARARIEAEESAARARAAAAQSGLGALEAEARALSGLIARGAGGAAGLLDALRVAEGFEAALGAALADELRAPETASGTGWRGLAPYDDAPPLPEGAAPLAPHVEGAPVLARRLALTGVVAAADGARLQPGLRPGQRLVSPEGDLWRWDGYAVAASDAPSAAGLRLQQVNRLAALGREIDETRAGAETEAAQARELTERLAQATAAERAARTTRRTAEAALSDASRARSKAEAEATLTEGRLESARARLARGAEDRDAAAARLSEAESALAGLDDLGALRAGTATLRAEVDAARAGTMARRSALDALRREGEARARRLAAIAREIGGWEARQGSAGGRLDEIARRRARTEDELARAREEPARLAARRTRLAEGLAQAGTRRQAAADALSAGEEHLRATAAAEREAERSAGEARERRAAAQAAADAATATTQAAAARIREDLDLAPERLLATLGADPERMPPAAEIEDEIARLRRQRDGMGAVNLRAEDDAREVQDEHDLLVREKTDLDAAIAELRRGIAGLNREGRERLLTAFEQVNANFATLFTHLFGGGEARLELIESDDPLDAGLEILCQPPGKRLSVLSLLSGGEQTLTAMALIFAVFLANPAPICVLDEVDAPLDDANVTRFCDLLDEMTRRTETRFLVITHHAVTMARMDRLFGVTMAEQGVSQLVSVDLKRAEAMVA